LAMIGNHQSVCLAIALFIILRATLYATLKREKPSFLVIHDEEALFCLIAARLCKYSKTEDKLSQVISRYPSPL
jgi:hypothetical protein